MSKILSVISANGDMTSFGYSASVDVTADQTIYTVTGTVPNPVPVPIPPVGPCAHPPNMVFLPNSQQQFVNFTPGQVLSYLVPMDSYKCAVTKNTGTPDNAKFTCWFSLCPFEHDELSASPNGTLEYNRNGGPCTFTRKDHVPPKTGYCVIPEVAYWNVTCPVASGAVISRTGPAV